MDHSLTSNGGYAPNHPYDQVLSHQVPATVLVPAEENYENDQLRLNIRPFNLTTLEYGDPVFLHHLASRPLNPASYTGRHAEWKYTDRNKAQGILPFLHLGPASIAKDRDYIVDNGITMVIAVRSAVAARKLPRLLNPARFMSCQGIETATFDVDSPFEMINRIRPVIRMMTAHLEQQNQGLVPESIDQVKGRILVFCETGNDRSPVLVAAYLMLLYGISWSDSLNLIHIHRFSVGLSSGLNEMLSNLEMVMKAQWDVSSSAAARTGEQLERCGRTAKRTIDDAYDSDDVTMEEVMPETRPGVAPFHDAK